MKSLKYALIALAAVAAFSVSAVPLQTVDLIPSSQVQNEGDGSHAWACRNYRHDVMRRPKNCQ